MQVQSRWAHYKTSIFTEMTLLAQEFKAINLAQGFPDSDGPEEIKESVRKALSNGFNQYAPSPGLFELRQALAAMEYEFQGLSYDPQTEVTVFSGATEAIFCAIQALCFPGDEILTLEPFYDSYLASAFSAHAKLVTVPLVAPDFTFDRELLRSRISPKTRMILLNSPHNPTGRVLSLEELDFIADLAKKHNLLVVADEVYEHIVFAPAKHVSIASLPDMRERTVIISSTSKTFSFTGWKVGYAFAPAEISRLLRNVHQFTVFCSATPLQAGLIEIKSLERSFYERLREDYLLRRDALVEVLQRNGFRCQAPQGTYFIVADYSEIQSREDLAFTKWLAKDIGVAAVPLSGFFLDSENALQEYRMIRFAFCKSLKTIEQAGERLKRLHPPPLSGKLPHRNLAK